MDGDEVAQVYIQYPTMERMPVKELKGFRRVHIPKGSESIVRFAIPVKELQKWDSKQKRWKLYPGTYSIIVSSSSQDERLTTSVKMEQGIQ